MTSRSAPATVSGLGMSRKSAMGTSNRGVKLHSKFKRYKEVFASITPLLLLLVQPLIAVTVVVEG
jgi:hypothetical protein